MDELYDKRGVIRLLHVYRQGGLSATSWNTFHVEVNGVDITGPIYIPNTGSGEAYQFVSVNNIPLEAGQCTLSVVIDGSGPDKGNFDYFTIDPYYPPQVCDPE